MTWALMAAVVWGAIVAALVTWWSGPENAIDYTRFSPGQFDLQGLAPVAYCSSAVALGIAAGSLVRRTIPTLAATVVTFAGVRVLFTEFIRRHFIPPVTTALPVGDHLSLLKQNVWTLSSHTLVQAGHVVSQPAIPRGCRGRAHFSTWNPRVWVFLGTTSTSMPMVAPCSTAVFLNPVSAQAFEIVG